MSEELKPISGRLLTELADVWENEGIDAASPERRAAFREAADTLRTMLQMPRIDTTLASDRSPTHRCTRCGAYWMQWFDSWSLVSNECGVCCDNSPDFLNVITPLIVSDIYTRPQPSAEPVAVWREALEQAADMIERAVCPNGEPVQCDAIKQFQTAAAAHLRALALKENPNAG